MPSKQKAAPPMPMDGPSPPTGPQRAPIRAEQIVEDLKQGKLWIATAVNLAKLTTNIKNGCRNIDKWHLLMQEFNPEDKPDLAKIKRQAANGCEAALIKAGSVRPWHQMIAKDRTKVTQLGMDFIDLWTGRPTPVEIQLARAAYDICKWRETGDKRYRPWMD